MAAEEWTIGKLLQWTTTFLRDKGVESPLLDAQVLLAHALNCRRTDLYVRHGEPASDEVRNRFRSQIKERVAGCPVAYLVGEREFFLLPFKVTRDVLIPRPETEGLVSAAFDWLKGKPAARVIDVGTGSGCIAVCLAKKLTAIDVTAVDISPAALAVARENAARNGVEERITFVECDLFAGVAGREFDLVVSNPPYVTSSEYQSLDRGVRDFEPRSALEAGPEGLDVYHRLIPGAAEMLVAGGAIMLEIGPGVEAGVRELFDAEVWSLRPTIADDQKLPRVVVAVRRE